MKLKLKDNYVLFAETKFEDYLFSQALDLYTLPDLSIDYSEFKTKQQGNSTRHIMLFPIKISINTKK